MKHEMQQEIVIRGTSKSGLQFLLPSQMEIEQFCTLLRRKLTGAGRFFQGAEATVRTGGRPLSTGEQAAIRSIFVEAEVNLRSFEMGEDPLRPPAAEARPVPMGLGTLPAAALLASSETALVVTRTLRSGQAVRHDGDVIVLGDVNPGAEVVAAGHIVVMGALKGLAHAGCTGNREAFVTAVRLRPTQLRIAGVVGRAPDQDESAQPAPEVARLVDDRIVIEAPVPNAR
jgi:septum site-determining protein MinC